MTELEHSCSFDKTERTCDYTCFACTFMHGVSGDKGLWSTTGVPNKYRGSRLSNLPIKEQNPKAYTLIERYIGDILSTVQEKNVGLFLYSIPEDENPFGTGTGKTTAATAILNHYVIERSRAYFSGKQPMKDNPAIFVKATELQNSFNAQFRGTLDMKDKASRRYYGLKQALKTTEFVVFDDIATRGSRVSEAFEEELYEIIDYRASQIENGATLFTSNVNMKELTKTLGDRIASRIAGMCLKVGFTGTDNRLDSLFK